jgi:hypothetical protein
MSKHRVGRNIRGGVAAGAALAAVALTTGAVYSSASAAPAPAPVSCADAITTYNHAQDNVAADQIKLTTANTELDDATKALADARAADAAEDSAKGAPVDDPKKPDAADVAKSAAESRAFRAGEAQSSAQSKYATDAGAASNAKAAADAACQGPAGPVGPGGVAGAVGPKGIDARIVLSPGVCARAVVTPDPEKLVRVVTLIPCPVAVPTPPAVEPKPGDEVVVIPPAAPVPPVQDAHLPVTH